MAKTYPVKWMSFTFRGAPQIDGSVGGGGYLAALHAFLVTGFGSAQALSVTVSNGVGTAVFPASTVFEYYSVLLIEGAMSPASLNGEARVLSQVGSTITFETDAPDGAATGTITFKYAPVGWGRVFSETNKAVFRSLDPQSSRFYFRIDDTGAVSARIRGFESMSDIDSGTGPFPTDAQISGGGYHMKSSAVSAVKNPYFLVGDSRFVHFAIAAGFPNGPTRTVTPPRGFGDLYALATSGDAFSTAISCAAGDTTGSTANFAYGTFASMLSSTTAIYVPREISGLGGAKAIDSSSFCGTVGLVSGADGALGSFPSSIDGQLMYSRRYVVAADGKTPRAIIPGILHIPQTGVAASIANGDLIVGGGEFVGRRLLALAAAYGVPTAIPLGASLIDITGPWR